LIPPRSTTFVQRSTSAFMNAPNSSGVLAITSSGSAATNSAAIAPFAPDD
jgi:hypothetical protein